MTASHVKHCMGDPNSERRMFEHRKRSIQVPLILQRSQCHTPHPSTTRSLRPPGISPVIMPSRQIAVHS